VRHVREAGNDWRDGAEGTKEVANDDAGRAMFGEEVPASLKVRRREQQTALLEQALPPPADPEADLGAEDGAYAHEPDHVA
jgi:hypothetical protein